MIDGQLGAALEHFALAFEQPSEVDSVRFAELANVLMFNLSAGLNSSSERVRNAATSLMRCRMASLNARLCAFASALLVCRTGCARKASSAPIARSTLPGSTLKGSKYRDLSSAFFHSTAAAVGAGVKSSGRRGCRAPAV